MTTLRGLTNFSAAFAAALLFIFSNTLKAQVNVNGSDIRAITTSVPFLLITPDSRHGALGEAGVAIAENSYAMHHNLAGLAFSENQMGFQLTYSPWLRRLVPDINLAYASGYYNLGGNNGFISSSIRYFDLGQIDFTDINGQPAGGANPAEVAIDFGYARRVTDNFSAGVALRYIRSNLAQGAFAGGQATKPGNSFAGDLNVMYKKELSTATPMTLSWGVNATNMGAKISYSNSNVKDFLPANLRAGLALKVDLDDYNSVTIMQDFNKLLVPSPDSVRFTDQTTLDGIFSSFGDAQGGGSEELREVNLQTGIEYWYDETFAARAGLFYEHPTKGNRQFVTFGAGLKYEVMTIDFAYLASLTQNHPLQNTIRVSLIFDFEPGGNR